MLHPMKWSGLLLLAGVLFGAGALASLDTAAGSSVGPREAEVGVVAALTQSASPTATPHRVFAPGSARVVASPTPPPPIPSCADLLAPVDKVRALGPGCVPPGLVALPYEISYLLEDPVLYLRQDAAASLLELIDAAEGNGLYIVVRSAYRGYEHQAALFAYWRDLLGEFEAERTSARAGHSEHQLGTAVDITSYTNDYGFEGFEVTLEGQWVAAHAHLFGFVISYPAGMEHRTGYVYEPWHLRYIGRANAAAVRASGMTLREWLAR